MPTDQLTSYYTQFNIEGSGSGTSISSEVYSSGYTCDQCGCFITYGTSHICPCTHYYYPYWYYPYRNKTEEAFNIIKKLVEKKIIAQPNSFKKFCDLMEAIKEAI